MVIRFVNVSLPVFMKLQISIWVWMEIDWNIKYENIELNSSSSSLVENRFQIFSDFFIYALFQKFITKGNYNTSRK